MKSRKNLTRNGFTIVEVLVAITITSVVLGLGLLITMDSSRDSSFKAETDLVSSLLQKARSRSLNNIHESPNGFHIGLSDYTLFRGSTYSALDPNNEDIPKGNVTITGVTDVVFDQLSGRVDISSVGDITMGEGSNSLIISINEEGRINY